MTKFAKLGWMMTAAAALLAVPAVASADPHGKAGAGGTTSAPSKRLGVNRLVLAHGIDNREPQEAATSFKSSDDRVYAFVELENPGRASDNISVVFEPPAGSPGAIEIPLSVGDSARFRTWAFTRKAHIAGEWTVIVRDGGHRVLARQTFTVT